MVQGNDNLPNHQREMHKFNFLIFTQLTTTFVGSVSFWLHVQLNPCNGPVDLQKERNIEAFTLQFIIYMCILTIYIQYMLLHSKKHEKHRLEQLSLISSGFIQMRFLCFYFEKKGKKQEKEINQRQAGQITPRSPSGKKKLWQIVLYKDLDVLSVLLS